eukprot:scaffold22581_cov123-Cylindrotheca_fusiformis.AAC.17
MKDREVEYHEILTVEDVSPSQCTLPSAANSLYRTAIIRAIDELKDFNLRSNIDAIRRHVESTLGPSHVWNDTLFLKTLKALAHEGDIEQCANVNCGLSPEFKQRRTKSMQILIGKRSQMDMTTDMATAPEEIHEKSSPARKPEHAKLKIIPKRIYDSLQ